MANINRDYLIINDVKKSNVSLDNGSITFYITDKNTQNIFVNLVINISDNKLIQKYANIENAEDYTLTMNIVKPDNTYEIIHGKLHDKANAIFEFDLPDCCCDKVGSYRCELLTKCYINDREEITTSNKITYKVKSSVLNDLDEITEAPEYPLVIQLFDKLSDIEQYEEDRRANELARQLAEEQRQVRFETLDADITGKITAMDNKIEDVENRVSAKEQAVDKLINDTKADIDEYKVAKDQEIDEYKAAKDTEINNAITAQDNKIDEAISNQNDRITVVENNVVAQNNRLDIVENKNSQQDNRLDVVEAKNAEQDSRLDAIEAIDVAQNNRLDAIEAKNQQQDDRLLDVEKVNKKQDIDIKCLYGASQTIDVTKEGNGIYLQNSNNGFAIIDEIKGNTLVNCNKEPDKELILNGNINTSGDNTVTLTEGVDGGKVDVALEGNTLVNVSKTKDTTAITKAYTVENSGNHIALQDDIDGSCRPVVTGNTLVNLMPNIDTSTPNTNRETSLNYYSKVFNLLQNNKTYTFKVFNNPCLTKFYISALGLSWIPLSSENSCTFSINQETFDNTTPRNFQFETTRQLTQQELDNLKFMILEGDYTDKPIPDYFEGLQSSFEDNLVTQEMIDSGEEVADNLGKYRVDYKVTGKNKFNKSKTLDEYEITGIDVTHNPKWFITDFIPVIPNTSYKISGKGTGDSVIYYGSNKQVLGGGGGGTSLITVPTDAKYVRLNGFLTQKDTFQIEEGDTATSYEPYKEYTKTLYLNSPLLEGDTIEEKDDGIYHVHRSELVAYTEGDEASLITDKVNTLHQLAEPQYELIEQSNLAIPSYTNGHLDFNTAVPVEKVEFKPFSEELTYLYPATSYTVQFVSDKALTADITLGGTSLLAQNIVSGLNRITMTTPSELVDNKLVISGAGANISEVVVTDTNRKFDYFEGMKSVGECEDLEVVSRNVNMLDINKLADKNNWLRGTYWSYPIKVKPNTNYTLSITGNKNKHVWLGVFGKPLDWLDFIKYVLWDGDIEKDKDYICKFNTGNKNIIYISMYNATPIGAFGENGQFKNVYLSEASLYNGYIPHQSNSQQLTHEPLRAVGDVKDRYTLIDGNWYIERNCREVVCNGNEDWGYGSSVFKLSVGGYPHKIEGNAMGWGICDRCPEIRGLIGSRDYAFKIQMQYIQIRNKDFTDAASFKSYLNSNPIKVVYLLETPIYEPIDYNPFEVYSEVTHIFTNSTIPYNVTVKNYGYNCLLKPNTTYTISSNLGLNTVTTPSALTEDCLRFMDTDTSDVTTMRDVLVLEGDWTSKADLIPANFSGIESAFEQEYDVEKGKYKVNVKVANEDKTKENNITFYINEPLRGVGDAKDRIYVKDDKVVVERNCRQVLGSEFVYNRVHHPAYTNRFAIQVRIENCYKDNVLCNVLPYAEKGYNKDYDNISSHKINDGVYINLDKGLWGFDGKNGSDILQRFIAEKQPILTVQTLEPTYEEVEYNDTKLFIESFKNSTLSYNSNVPVTSKLYYSYSVPIVDTVAKTANISDQQDSMIIDLATQVAVMEMMLM